MALLPTNGPGEPLVYANAAEAGDTFSNGGREVVNIRNAGASPITVTVSSEGECDQGFTHDVEYEIADDEDLIIGPFDPRRFGSTVSMTYDEHTDVTLAVLGWGG